MKSTIANAMLCALLACSAQPATAATIYITTLKGSAEVPSNASAGTGTAIATIDNALASLTLTSVFFNLAGNVTGASLHCCAPNGANAGRAIDLPAFPIGTKAGGYARVFNLLSNATYTSAFRAANGGTALSARSALLAGFASGGSYLNIRSRAFSNGEVRGQFALVAPVPEPAIWISLISGMLLTGALIRRQVRSRRRVRYVLA